jgi:hypothetical protein
MLAGLAAAVLASAPPARAQQPAERSPTAWEEHVHTAAAVAMPGTGDLAGPAGGEADLGREGPWEVRGVPGKPASSTSASGAGPELDQTRPFAMFGLGALGGVSGTAVTDRTTDPGIKATAVTDRTTDPGIKPTGVDLARQRPTVEHGSFNLSGDGRSFGLDTWTTSSRSSFNSSFNF